jgi:hypothetical protein
MQALRSHKDTDLPLHISIWDIFNSSSSSNTAIAASMSTPTFASSTSTTASTTASTTVTPSGAGASSEEQHDVLHKTKSGSRWGAAGIASRRKQSTGVYAYLS